MRLNAFSGTGSFSETFKAASEDETEVFESEETLSAPAYCSNSEGVVLTKSNASLVTSVTLLLTATGSLDLLKKLNRFVFGCPSALFFPPADF